MGDILCKNCDGRLDSNDWNQDTLDSVHRLSVNQALSWSVKGDKNIYLIELLWELNVIISVKCLAQYLAHGESKVSISVSIQQVLSACWGPGTQPVTGNSREAGTPSGSNHFMEHLLCARYYAKCRGAHYLVRDRNHNRETRCEYRDTCNV